MGRDIDIFEVKEEDRKKFTERLYQNLDALKLAITKPGFGEGDITLGAELESCIVSHDDVVESAACGIPDEVKGEVIITFVVLKEGVNTETKVLEKELVEKIRTDMAILHQSSKRTFRCGAP